MDFKTLMSQSGKESLTVLNEKVKEMKDTKRSDDRFWTPTVDKMGNGYAVIRFLPATKGENVPFVRIFDHGFQGPGGWYIENSLTTIGLQDPVGEFNSKLWNSTTDDKSPEREQVRKQKRRLHFISNIIVLNDSANPENEGKVFLFKYGKKIFKKLEEAMEPQFQDEEAFNPFHLKEGANFKLKIRNVEGYRNYDKSEFEKVSPLYKDEDHLKAVWESQYLLQPFLASENFKSYSELKEKLNRVLGGEETSRRATDEVLDVKTTRKQTYAPQDDDDDVETEEMKYFKSLAV